MTEKLKVVQIGVVHDHAGQNLNALRTQTDVFEVLGYAVPEEEAGMNTPPWCKGLTRYTVEEALALPGLQGVVVETGELRLTKYATLAARRGLAVFMDKPGGIDLAAFEQLITLVKEKHIPFHVGYMYRYNPAVRQLLTDIREGKLGDIYSMEAHMDCFHNPQKRQWLDQFPGGMMFFLGCHLIDLIYQIQGEPNEVLPLNCATGTDGVTGQDYGMAVLKYPQGVSFAKTCAAEPGGFLRRQLVVCGSKGPCSSCPLRHMRRAA